MTFIGRGLARVFLSFDRSNPARLPGHKCHLCITCPGAAHAVRAVLLVDAGGRRLARVLWFDRSNDACPASVVRPRSPARPGAARQARCMAEDTVTVRLVGGPADWAGKTLALPRGQVLDRPLEEVGAYLTSDCTPERGEDEDVDPRAIYEPEDDATVWTFRGWFPSSPSDPPVA